MRATEQGRDGGTSRDYQDLVKSLTAFKGTIEERAAQQGKTQHLETIYDIAFGPLLSCPGADTHSAEHPTVTPGALHFMHAGMVALARLTKSDDLVERLRPNIIAHADDVDFRREFAVAAKRNNTNAKMTPKRYGAMVDTLAGNMLKHVGAA